MPRKPASFPAQKRSRATRDRIFAATLELLRDKPFDSITVREIVTKAGCPIASFYSRFNSKDEVLTSLYDRHNRRLHVHMLGQLHSIHPGTHSYRAAVAGSVDTILGYYTRHALLLREVTLFARRQPDAIGAPSLEIREMVHRWATAVFRPYANRIRHKDPVRAAGVGIFITAAAARERILFGGVHDSYGTDLSEAALRHSLIHALHSFLTRPCAAPHLCCLPRESEAERQW